MIQIAETNLGAVLDAATEKPAETPIERADRKFTEKRRAPRKKNAIKPAAQQVVVKKTPATKPASQTVSEIHAACSALNIEVKEFGSGSFVLRLPTWADFKAKLPTTGAVAEVKLFHSLRDAISGLTGDAKATWVFHRTGSFAVYSRMAK